MDDEAICYLGKSWTYSELKQMTDQAADAFHCAGLKLGDTVLIGVSNSPEAVVALLALNKLGVVTKWFDLRAGEADIQEYAVDSNCRYLIAFDILIPKIEKILDYIDERILDEIEIKPLAEKFGYSPFHFHRFFSAVTEQTMMEYIRKRRHTIAHQKLCKTQERVADICYSVGFNSIQTFNRAFKETFGTQPLEARESQAFITYRDVPTIVEGYHKMVDIMKEEFNTVQIALE